MTDDLELLMNDRTRRFVEVLTEYQKDPAGKAFCCELDGYGYLVQKGEKGYAIQEFSSIEKARRELDKLNGKQGENPLAKLISALT